MVSNRSFAILLLIALIGSSFAGQTEEGSSGSTEQGSSGSSTEGGSSGSSTWGTSTSMESSSSSSSSSSSWGTSTSSSSSSGETSSASTTDCVTTGEADVTTGSPEVTTGETEVTTGKPEITTGEAAITTDCVTTGETEVTTGKVEATTGKSEATSAGSSTTGSSNVTITTGKAEITTGAMEATTGKTEATTGATEVTTGRMATSAGSSSGNSSNVNVTTGMAATTGKIEATSAGSSTTGSSNASVTTGAAAQTSGSSSSGVATSSSSSSSSGGSSNVTVTTASATSTSTSAAGTTGAAASTSSSSSSSGGSSNQTVTTGSATGSQVTTGSSNVTVTTGQACVCPTSTGSSVTSAGSSTGSATGTSTGTTSGGSSNSTTPNCPFFDYINTCPGLSFTLNGFSLSFLDFQVITFGDFFASSGDLEGRLAARGSVEIIGGFSIGYAIQNTGFSSERYSRYSLIAGNITWTNGALYPDGTAGTEEDGFVAGSVNVAPYLKSRFSGPCSGCLTNPFSSALNCYNTLQATLAQLSANVQVQLQYSAIQLTCNSNSSSRYVANVDGALFQQATWYSLVNCASGAQWVINVLGNGSVTFQGGNFPESSQNVVYNVLGSGRYINVVTQLNGGIVAPFNILNQTNGVIMGKVVVGDIANVLQINKPICPSFNNLAHSFGSVVTPSVILALIAIVLASI